MPQQPALVVGVLALQGAFSEHLQLLRKAAAALIALQSHSVAASTFSFIQVRTVAELDTCDALIVPGGESTTISLVASRSGLLEPLREFVKVTRKPTWGTCAGLILLAESANRTKKGGQELIGGLDVRVNRNHFGRQTESFTTNIPLPFLAALPDDLGKRDFHAVFIRAPIVEKVLPTVAGIQEGEAAKEDTVVAPSLRARDNVPRDILNTEVKVMATLAHRASSGSVNDEDAKDIIAVQQGNCFGTSFHPELTDDPRIHIWWLQQVLDAHNACNV